MMGETKETVTEHYKSKTFETESEKKNKTCQLIIVYEYYNYKHNRAYSNISNIV